MVLLGMTLEEAQKIISLPHPEQIAFLTGKYRAKARKFHPDKEGEKALMQTLNLTKDWLTTAENIRDSLVAFMNSERSRRERVARQRAEEEQKAQAEARLEEYKNRLTEHNDLRQRQIDSVQKKKGEMKKEIK